jgi:hypothetical protein
MRLNAGLRKTHAETAQQIAARHGIPWISGKRQPPKRYIYIYCVYIYILCIYIYIIDDLYYIYFVYIYILLTIYYI